MTKFIGIFLLAAIIAAGVVWQRIPTDVDPLRIERVELQRVRILKAIESLKVSQAIEQRETAIVKAKLARQERLENSAGVSLSAVVLAVTWRMTPAILLLSSLTGAAVYAWRKPVLFEFEGIRAFLPRHAVPEATQQALVTKERAEMVKAFAYAESVTKERVDQIIGAVKAMRPGRESVSITQTALPAAAVAALPVPTFADLFSAGKFEPGKPLVFGFQQDTGQPKTGTWASAYSLGIAGTSGSGKSSTIRLMLAESLLTGAAGSVYIIDPHYPHPESLLASMGDLIHAPQVTCCVNPIDTAAMIDEIHAHIDARIACTEASTPLIIVVIDELISAVNTFPQVAKLVERIGMESRKAGVYGCFAAQNWNGDKVGGTAARDGLAALLVHKMKKKAANVLLQDNELAKQVDRLQPGQILFSPTKGEPELLTVPYCAVEDMPVVVRRLSNGAGYVTTGADALPRGAGRVGTQHTVDDTENTIDVSEVNSAVNVDLPHNVVKFPVDLRNADTLTGHDLLTVGEICRHFAEKMTRKEVKLTAIAEAVKMDAGFLSKVLKGQKKMPDALRQRLSEIVARDWKAEEEARS